MKNKICVYAICKNESQFVDKWYESMKEADEIVVVDTGSTDDTVEKLKACGGIRVFEKTWNPWRFDEPRNYALDMASEDCNIFISTDLDEILEPGWANVLRAKWIEGKHVRARYKYAWSHTESGEPARIFYYDKIHSREWRWIYPVHELLARDGNCDYTWDESINLFDDIFLHHYPDPTKSRGTYLNLLELRAKEFPDNDIQGKLYLAHEYLYRHRFQECVDFINTHLLPNKHCSYQAIEIANIYVFLGDAYRALGQDAQAWMAWTNALMVDPTYREPYLRLAEAANKNKCYKLAVAYVEECIAKTHRQYSWLEQDRSWMSMPHDILAIAYYYLGEYDKAYAHGKKALKLSSIEDKDRLQENLNFMENKFLS